MCLYELKSAKVRISPQHIQTHRIALFRHHTSERFVQFILDLCVRVCVCSCKEVCQEVFTPFSDLCSTPSAFSIAPIGQHTHTQSNIEPNPFTPPLLVSTQQLRNLVGSMVMPLCWLPTNTHLYCSFCHTKVCYCIRMYICGLYVWLDCLCSACRRRGKIQNGKSWKSVETWVKTFPFGPENTRIRWKLSNRFKFSLCIVHAERAYVLVLVCVCVYVCVLAYVLVCVLVRTWMLWASGSPWPLSYLKFIIFVDSSFMFIAFDFFRSLSCSVSVSLFLTHSPTQLLLYFTHWLILAAAFLLIERITVIIECSWQFFVLSVSIGTGHYFVFSPM